MTHTSTEQERAEFEAWAIANNKYHVSGYNPHSDLWEAWQAARSAPVGAVPQWDGVIKPSDFTVDTFRSGGSGWVPRPDNRVRITHRPTGFFEEENAMRSVHANKAVAWQRLSDRLESLAAEPQPPDAAAPVELPKPVGWFHRHPKECKNGEVCNYQIAPADRKDGWEEFPLYTEQQVRTLLAEVSAPAAQADAKDAARYRWLRDNDWRNDEKMEPVIRLQLNAIWDEKIDAAMTAQARNKKGIEQ